MVCAHGRSANAHRHRSKGCTAGHPQGGGSSPDAEEMLSRMLENVLHIQRQEVAIYDLARDGREPSVIGLGVVDALSGSAPEVVIVMGAFAARHAGG